MGGRSGLAPRFRGRSLMCRPSRPRSMFMIVGCVAGASSRARHLHVDLSGASRRPAAVPIDASTHDVRIVAGDTGWTDLSVCRGTSRRWRIGCVLWLTGVSSQFEGRTSVNCSRSNSHKDWANSLGFSLRCSPLRDRHRGPHAWPHRARRRPEPIAT